MQVLTFYLPCNGMNCFGLHGLNWNASVITLFGILMYSVHACRVSLKILLYQKTYLDKLHPILEHSSITTTLKLLSMAGFC